MTRDLENLANIVTKHESEIVNLTANMASLVINVRELGNTLRAQSEQTAEQIKQLLVNVTTAAGPRKTDWPVLIGLIMLILAVGAYAFKPLDMRIDDLLNRAAATAKHTEKQLADLHSHTVALETRFDEHQKLELHPVGASKVTAFDTALRERAVRNEKDISDLDVKLQKEFGLMTQLTDAKVAALDAKLQIEMRLLSDTLAERLKGLDRLLEQFRNEGAPGLAIRVSVLEERMKTKIP